LPPPPPACARRWVEAFRLCRIYGNSCEVEKRRSADALARAVGVPRTIRAQAPEQWRSGCRAYVSPRNWLPRWIPTTRRIGSEAYPCWGPAGRAAFCVRIAVSQTRSTQTIVLDTNAKRHPHRISRCGRRPSPDVLIMNADDGARLGVWINDGHVDSRNPTYVPIHRPSGTKIPSLPEARSEHASLASLNGVQHSAWRHPR